MNYKKIKKYNQLLLAMAGTIGVLFMLVSGIYIASEFLDYNRGSDEKVGILSKTETDFLNQDSLRGQIISFDKIRLVDSINQYFLFPVSQANLVDLEKSNELLGIINSYERSIYYNSETVYNNLVLCDLKNGKSKIIFDERISVTDFLVHEYKEKVYIVISANNVDSNKDKYLDSEDLQNLYIYDVSSSKLTKIDNQQNSTLLKVYQPMKSNHLIGQFGIDRNLDGIFISYSEPMIYYKIDLNNMSLIKLVNDDQINKLQRNLEGKK